MRYIRLGRGRVEKRRKGDGEVACGGRVWADLAEEDSTGHAHVHQSVGGGKVEVDPFVEFFDPLPAAIERVAFDDGGPAFEDGAYGNVSVEIRVDGMVEGVVRVEDVV